MWDKLGWRVWNWKPAVTKPLWILRDSTAWVGQDFMSWTHAPSDFNSATTIYLSYSYNPVATNTNLRAVTLVYPCSGLNIDSNDVMDYHFESEKFSFKIHRSWLLCSFYFHHFAANTFLYLPRVFVCEFCSPFLHLYMFFPTEWTLSISSWIIYFSRICHFFTRWEVFSLTSDISFRVNSFQFFLSDKFIFFLLLVFFPGFSSRPLCPK